jgi:hypothetical protein
LIEQRAYALLLENTPMTDTAKYKSYSQFEEFLRQFYSLSQTARIHSETHTMVIEGIKEIFRIR